MMPYRAWRLLMLRAMMPRLMRRWLPPGYAPIRSRLRGRAERARARSGERRAQFAHALEQRTAAVREAPARARAAIPYDTASVAPSQRRETQEASGGRSASARSAQRSATRSSARDHRASEPTDPAPGSKD